MEDKTSVSAFIEEHEKLFGPKKIKTFGTDKGYYSAKNQKIVTDAGVKKNGLQIPGNVKLKKILKSYDPTLKDRRAGIEPLIGHAKKRGQLGKSRMKSDAATLAAGYASIMSFNLRQTIRNLNPQMMKKAA